MRPRRYIKECAAAVGIAVALLAPPSAGGSTITVSKTGDEPILSPNTGDCSLREAVQAANTNAPEDTCPAGQPAPNLDTIVLPDIPPFGADTFELGFDPGDDNNNEGDLDVNTSGGPVVIDGRSQALTRIDANDVDRVLDIMGTGAATVQDLLVLDGRIDAPAEGTEGGGIRSAAASLTLSNVDVSVNIVTGAATMRGGGLRVTSGTLTLSNSIISDNQINRTTTAGAEGGSGGGISFGSLAGGTIDRTRISNNLVFTASDDDQTQGGGIGVLDAEQAVSIANSTISGNSVAGASVAANLGGGISWGDSDNGDELELENVTFSGNSASTGLARGGGIWISGGTVSMAFTTFGPNTAGEGNGLWINGSGGLVQQRGTLLETGDEECAGDESPTSLGFNAELTPGSCGWTGPGDVVSTSDLLEPLADNGGPTRTHELSTDSGLKDAVPVASCLDADGAPLLQDQRGAPRQFDDGVVESGPNCDPGAYEEVQCRDEPAKVIGTPGADMLTGTVGSEMILGLGGADVILPGAGSDRVCAGDGDDRLGGGDDDASSDFYGGGSGSDTYDLTDFNSGATVNLATGVVTPSASLGNEFLDSLENVIGGDGGDTLTGDAGSNRLDGASGSDTITGAGGSDQLLGNFGNLDALFARDGIADAVDCGPGTGDTAQTDRLSLDQVSGCESLDALAEPAVLLPNPPTAQPAPAAKPKKCKKKKKKKRAAGSATKRCKKKKR